MYYIINIVYIYKYSIYIYRERRIYINIVYIYIIYTAKKFTVLKSPCTYEPYKKDNHAPIYIHTSSNHPPSITKQIPKSTSRRLSSNSSNIDIFNKHKQIYYKALKHSGYRQELEFTPPKDKSKHRSRNIIWFNPPYNKCISSNIGRDFLNLISKHFPNNSPLAKIFNKNNIKASYSCTNNIAQIIKTQQKNRIHQ